MPEQPETTRDVVLALDLGGTWIKGAAGPATGLRGDLAATDVRRWPNPLATATTGETYAAAIVALCRELAGDRTIRAVVASTAGEVDARGQRYLVAGRHLGAMATTPWRARAAAELAAPFTLINDAESFLLGWAEGGSLPVDRAVGALVVGTGLGFAVARLGRWWKPARSLNFLGCARLPDGTYDDWISAVAAAQRAGGDLARLLSAPEHAAARQDYLRRLAAIAATATVLYRLDEIVLGGGLAEAAGQAGCDLTEALTPLLPALLPPNIAPPRLHVAASGNLVTLRGALAFAAGNAAAEPTRFTGSFASLPTESAAGAEALEGQPAAAIAHRLAAAEHAASADFLAHAPALGPLADRLADTLRAGGRILCVGAGTSGRVAALDAVELPCTFGLAADRWMAVVAGGAADSALTIEDNGEEDCSAVPDLLLLQPGPRDLVLGVSASGTAFFVRSALACARQRGAHTVLLHESPLASSTFCDQSLRLHSGPELLPGSTRLKAGTATKKALNILSTTALIRLGKVRHGLMVDLACSNEKLRHRAEDMLARLAGLSPREARAALARHGYRLRDALAEFGV